MNVIVNDAGGSIADHILLGQHYAAVGAKLVVVYCASACLNLLAEVPKNNICITPPAWIGYHTNSQRPDGTEDTWTMRWERGRDWIDRGYAECRK